MADKEELYEELKQLDEQVKNLNAHLEKVDEQIAELTSSKLIIGKFGELKKSDELRVPLTSGIYIKAELTDTKKLMVNVGAGVAVEKTPQQIDEILNSQLKDLGVFRETIVGNMKELIARVEVIQKEFE
jgi:prefoldin alpha subunit